MLEPSPANAAALVRRSIARRYSMQVAGIAAALLLASGATEMYFSFREAKIEMARLQAAQAEGAAREIKQYLQSIDAGLDQVTRLPWGLPGFAQEHKREEFHRLMSLFPAILQMRDLSPQGQERLFVSRSDLDRVDGHAPRGSALPLPPLAGFGSSYFGLGAEPLVDLNKPSGRGEAAGMVSATIKLRFLADGLSKLRVGEGGRTFVLDADNRLIAHPQATQVLRQLQLSNQPAVQAARQNAGRPGLRVKAMETQDFDGKPVIATAVALGAPDWLVFVEQPRAEALESAFATLRRTLILFGLGGGLAVLVAGWYARQLARPIVQLREAAGRIAQGDLSSRIATKGEDELAQLAGDFNLMAGQLQASYIGLEAKVATRTQELSLARDDALQANAAKTRFLAAASHDLRQPMHTISLLVSLLRERLRGRQAMELADKLSATVHMMEGLFSGLLDISKLDAGAVKPQLESFQIERLLRHLEHAFATQAESRGLRLRVRSCGALVRSDPAMLESILSNLVSNALRYTQQGGVLVACRRRGSQMLAIQVWDSGCGIDASESAAVFDEFYRVAPLAGQSVQGLGLGLSIVKRSAELLGHRLRLCSEPGRGSLFEVELPLVAGMPSGLSQAQGQVLPGGPADVLAGNFVLIIEDDRDNREVLESLCQQWGLLCVAASGGAQAQELLATHLRAPDLILSDFHLADGERGDEAIGRIRELLGEAVPALILSAEMSEEVSTRARACGALLLTKPANTERLLAALQALLAPQQLSLKAQPDQSVAPNGWLPAPPVCGSSR